VLLIIQFGLHNDTPNAKLKTNGGEAHSEVEIHQTG